MILKDYPAPRYPKLSKISSEEVYRRIKDYVAVKEFPKGLSHEGGTSTRVHFIDKYDVGKGDRVLLVGSTEYDLEVLSGYAAILKERGASVSTFILDLGKANSPEECAAMEATTLTVGEDNDAYTQFCSLLMGEAAKCLAKTEKFDFIIAGSAGPIPPDIPVRDWYRTTYISNEEIASKQIELTPDLQFRIDQIVYDQIMSLEKGRLTDPEGTDVAWTNYDDKRPLRICHEFAKPLNIGLGGKPDCSGVVAGTINHMGAFPRIKAHVKDDLVVKVEGGGKFGDAWREKLETLNKLNIPPVPLYGDESKLYEFPGPGFFWYWEIAVGTRPGVFRLQKEGLQQCFANFLHDRLRAGYIHNGFGVPSTVSAARVYTKIGVPWTHVHIHSMFPTLEGKTKNGSTIKIIDKGHLSALDDPEVRKLASKYGDPDQLLNECWIPAVPGINLEGDYERDYAKNPIPWIIKDAEAHPTFT